MCAKVETIVLKEGVTKIGGNAFYKCSNLSTVVWPESVTSVGNNVFEYCKKLDELAGSDNQDNVIVYLKSITPLMKLCIADAKLEDIKKALEEDPDVANKSEASGRSVLSYCAQYGSSEEALELLLEKNPEAAKAKDKSARTPLHYLFDNSVLVSPFTVNDVASLYPMSLRSFDSEGQTPIELLPKDIDAKEEILNVVLDFGVGQFADGDLHKDMFEACREGNPKSIEALVKQFACVAYLGERL